MVAAHPGEYGTAMLAMVLQRSGRPLVAARRGGAAALSGFPGNPCAFFHPREAR